MGDSLLARAEHKLFVLRRQKKLKNKTPSILSSNCNGAIMLYDLGCRYNSPTVNLYFNTADFLRLLSNPAVYLRAELTEQKMTCPFPVGKLNDIFVYFMHYESFAQAKQKWEERATRVDPDNLFVMMTDRNGCTYEDLQAFDALPYAHKVVFTHKPYPEIKSAFYIPGFEDAGEVGVLSDWKPGFWKRRWLDAFDSAAFLNGEIYSFEKGE